MCSPLCGLHPIQAFARSHCRHICLGPYGGPREVGVSHERGTSVRNTVGALGGSCEYGIGSLANNLDRPGEH